MKIMWKIIKEVAFLGPALQFLFWAIGALDALTAWLKAGNHWIFSLTLIMIYGVLRWSLEYLYIPSYQMYQKRLRKTERNHKRLSAKKQERR